MELIANQVNAALVSFEIIQTKQKVNLIVLQNCETALQNYAAHLHVGQVDSAENPGGSHSDGHTCKPVI